MWNLYFNELNSYRRHFLIWLLITLFFTVFIMSFYPSLSAQGADFDQMMKNLPPALTKAFNMEEGYMSNFLAYYRTYYGLHIMILTGIFAITLAGSILAKEEGQRTAEFLLTKPLWRDEIIAGKLLAVITLVITFIVLQISVSLLCMEYFVSEDVSRGRFAILNIYGALLTFLFIGIGFAISAVSKRGKPVTGAVVGIVIACFVINALARISDKTEFLGRLSPFYYTDFEAQKSDYFIEPWRVAVLAGVGLLGLAAGWWFYRRKDILT